MGMFKRVLIANRGEIALRVQRTCRELGIETVAVYSEPDRNALHVQRADFAVHIGAGPSTESYLVIQRIIDAALTTGAEAIHPGYGFLSENPEFSSACEKAGLIFIGPPASAMQAMGDKVAARKLMEQSGVPVVPGAHDIDISDIEGAVRASESVGFPLLVKAASGGGGRGIRLVEKLEELESAMIASGREAEASFGDGTVFLERYVEPARHIEVQIMADAHGNVRAYGERECSVQRRHQKLVEEAPSVAVDSELRDRLCSAAILAARSCGYRNAGTVEFLMEGSGEFFFLEMNARLQVEHPVTEFVYGIDLVAQQLAVANGEELSSDDDAMPAEPRGWAIECRINGEDPYQAFMPSLGLVEHVEVPLGPGTRFDSLLFDGLELPIFYDSLLGKLIVWAESRPDAIARMRRALDDLVIAGVQTNAPFHSALLDHPDFISGDIHTSWVESTFEMPSLPTDDPRKTQSLIAAALSADLIDQERPATGQSDPGTGWRRTARATAVNTGSQDGGLRGWRRGTAS